MQYLRQSLTQLYVEIIQNTVQKFACSCLLIVLNYILPGALANTVTIDKLPFSQATRNELLSRLLSEITLDDVGKQVKRRHFLECRGEGVGIILNESQQLSEKTPLYELHNEELCLTIFAAKISPRKHIGLLIICLLR